MSHTITIEDVSDAYTISEVAKILDRDPQTIRRYIRSGRLEAVRPGGSDKGPLYVTKRALTEFVNRSRRRPVTVS